MSEFELIRAEAANFKVNRLCALLGVSRSGYYGHVARQEAQPARNHERLIVKMRAIHATCGRTYGVRRMQRELVADGEQVGRRLVRRLMRQGGIVAVQTRRFRKTTNSDHGLGFSPNLLQQDFSTAASNEVWVGDITYIWTAQGWCYLAVLLDLYSRRVVGWAMDCHMRTELPLRALMRALEARNPAAGFTHHTDRGSQYAARSYRDVLAQRQAKQSMSDAGNCFDNAVAESFFASLKKERLHLEPFATRTEAYDAVEQYIEGFYNPTRRHSALGYISPLQYERQGVAQAA